MRQVRRYGAAVNVIFLTLKASVFWPQIALDNSK